MKTSVSNIAWGGPRDGKIVRTLLDLGVDGVELAPTMVWPAAPDVPLDEVRGEGRAWRDAGLEVAAVQSLLYGHPEMQLLADDTGDIVRHLGSMIEVAGALGARAAVFGSPRNRLRGSMSIAAAHERAAERLAQLVPALRDEGVVLTLEPNAPQYGADYLVEYADCVALAEMIDSPWIAPQIDTGCLTMVGADIVADIRSRTPAHVHLSAPDLAAPPAGIDHEQLARTLTEQGYDGWVTLEMRQPQTDSTDVFAASVELLVSAYGGRS